MKTFICLIQALFLTTLVASADTTNYTNFIRQYQTPSNVVWDCSDSVAANGSQVSSLAINPGGARFDLWTIASNAGNLTEYLLNTCYVGTYVPIAVVSIRSEDPYADIYRTRADRPFYVDITVNGLLSGAADPEASKSVKMLRHVQSYGVGGTGVTIDRTQATLLSQASITTNGDQTLTYTVNSVPAADRTKVRGEERFSIFSVADIRPPTYNIPETQIASRFIQIWPVADASIAGITSGQLIRYQFPQVTLTYNDLYPRSDTYAQVYKGEPQLGRTGTVVPGSSLILSDSIPVNRVLTLSAYDSVFDSDGRWTMEIVTVTPFGIDRLAYVSFDVDRTLKANGTFTTIE
jgi:hypothetical protein